MDRCGIILAIVAATCLAIGCGSTAAENPAAPSPVIPSLLGEWHGSGDIELTRADGSSFGSRLGCHYGWVVRSQEGGDFSGQVSIGGNSHNADRVCPYSGSFRGTITPGGAITIRLDPPYTQGCSRVEGDGIFTGTMRPDGTVFIQTSAAATCVGTDNRMHDGTRTVTFPWGWRF